MRNKTLFRLLLKAIGVFIFAQGVHEAFATIGSLLYLLGAQGGVSFASFGWYGVASAIGCALYITFGLYLFFGGQWIVDKAVPSNRPYCPECGYDLTGATRNRCPECGIPFKQVDVSPDAQLETAASETHPNHD